jgi:hypothetical protein
MMPDHVPANGTVVLLKTPGGEGDAAIVAYLATLLPKTPPQRIADRISGKKPLALLLTVPETASVAILRRLRELGAEAAFEKKGIPPPAESPPAVNFPRSVTPPPVPEAFRPPPASAPAARASLPMKNTAVSSPRPALRGLLPTAILCLLVVALVALIARHFGIGPRLPLAQSMDRLALALDPGRSRKTAAPPDSSGLASFFPPPPSVMTVPPQEMPAAYRAQLQERPDRRFPMALETLTRRWEQLAGIPAGTCRMGAAVYGDKEIRIPLLHGEKTVSQINLPLPASFAQGLGALAAWVGALERDSAKLQIAPADAVIAGEAFRKAQGLTGQVDPRQIILGLQGLDTLARPGVKDPRLLLAAARGYAWLTFVLVPDRQVQADPFAAEALAFLALAKHLDPGLAVEREEAVLAVAMGYTGHATALLAKRGESPAAGDDAAIDAYLRRDPLALRALRDAAPPGAPGALPHYLLARLYGSLGLTPEAEAAALELLKRSQTYPALVENIQSGDLGLAKRLTVLYPLDILSRMEAQVNPDLLKEPAVLEKRLQALSGEESTGEITLARFEELLAAWEPFAKTEAPRFLIDADRVRLVFRILYTDALALRFDLLLKQWAVVELAKHFVQSVSSEKEDNPLVLSMQAKLANTLGQGESVQRLVSRILADPRAGGKLAYDALLQVPLAGQRAIFPAAAAHLDGRPFDRYLLGYLHHYSLYDLEAAAHCYETALALDPFLFHATGLLAHARGTPEPLEKAAATSPTSYELAEELGDFLVERHDPASLARAATAYRTAAKTAPSRNSLVHDLGRVLTELKRYPEALEVYDAWLQKYGDEGLGTVIKKGQKAEVYLAMGQPRKALEALDGVIESYQEGVLVTAARANEKVGKVEEATRLYAAAAERYPTSTWNARAIAAFRWRQKDDQAAAKNIARVRAQNRNFSTWYADDFARALGDASPERILAAVDALRNEGAPAAEQLSLAHWLDRRGRTDVAAGIAMAAHSPQMMENLDSITAAYGFLRRSAGRPAASDYFRRAVPPQVRGPALMVMYTRGEYEGVLEEVGDPESYGPQLKEFIWLQALIASLSLDKPPLDWVDRLRAHYTGAGSPDYYFAIGASMEGLLAPQDLLAKITTEKQRCEIPYYLGLAARLKGDFPAADAWYQITLQTGLQNNGEYHWAADELFEWAHLGMAGRNRQPRDDVRAVREKMLARD